MLRRAPLRFHNLLSRYSHGRSANSPLPETSLAHCVSSKSRHFLNPGSTLSPIQSIVLQCLREYSTKPKKEYKEVNLACPEDIERLKQYLIEAEQEWEERRKAKADDPNASDSEEEEIRMEDYEPELKIFEDPFLDREPPPEPDEQTKKDVAEMVETLKLLVDQMPMQKPSKKRQGRGNKGKGGSNAQEMEDEMPMLGIGKEAAKVEEEGSQLKDEEQIKAAARIASIIEEALKTEEEEEDQKESKDLQEETKDLQEESKDDLQDESMDDLQEESKDGLQEESEDLQEANEK